MSRAATTAAAVTLFAAGATLLAGGCEWLDRVKTTRDGATTGGGPVDPVSADKLVNYLNTQAAHLQSVRYPDVSIDVKAGRESHSLNSSTLVCAKPRNFLLVGGKLIMPDIVNIGSNDQEFWMSMKALPGSPPTYIYCSHADFPQAGRQLPVPFDPNWALQALGMTTYPPNMNYQVETDQKAKEHRLTFNTETPQGTPVRREIAFDPYDHGPRSPQVRRHLILAAGAGNGTKPIAVAEIREVTTVATQDPQTGQRVDVQVPTVVTLSWPQQEFRMELRLGKPIVNERMPDAEMQRMFTKPQIDGVNPINLANAQFSPSSFRGATPSDLPPRRRP